MSAPQGKRGVRTALQNVERLTDHALTFLAKLLLGPSWFFEQKNGRVMDHLENQRSGV